MPYKFYKEELREQIRNRINYLVDMKQKHIYKANMYHEFKQFDDEDWERCRANEISSRISELERIIDLI